MIPLGGLTSDELVALHDDMAFGPYVVQPDVQLLSRDHEVLADLSDRVTAGQVDCKLTGQISTRSCNLTLLDPRREIAIDGVDASDGAFFYDKMVAAGVRFFGPRIGRIVDIPLFCGPLTEASREGWNAHFTGQGKERLATGMVWTPRTYPAGSEKIATVSDLLVSTGEDPARLHLPGLPGRIPKDIILGRTDRAWPPVTEIAESVPRQPMYDGRGDFRLRAWPEDPAVTITDGEGGTMLSYPQVTYDAWRGFNGVWVKGPVKRSGKRIESVKWLPRNHPQSPWSMQRGGIPFKVAYVVTNSKVRSQAEADEIARRYLRRLARELVHVTVDVMPNWLLEPGDIAAFATPSLGHIEQVLDEFSIPLVGATPMSLGATKTLTRIPRRHRGKHQQQTTGRRRPARERGNAA